MLQRIRVIAKKTPVAGTLLAFACFFVGFSQSNLSVSGVMAVLFSPASQNPVKTFIPKAHHLPVQKPHQRVDCTREPCVALTFDDGPNPITTPQILDILDRHQARGSFFLVGSRVHGHEHLVRRMFFSGHEIGNHSWDHSDFTKLTHEQMTQQINSTQAAIIATGVPAPHLFRPPYGAVNTSVRASVPLTIALWNVDPLDWKVNDPSIAAQNMIALARPGAVVDLHDIYATTAQSIEPVVIELKKHYRLVTFSELMNLQPGQPGEYYGR